MITRRNFNLIPAVLTLGGVTARSQGAQAAREDLLAGFKAPPASAQPRTWWHWTHGNITLDGIRKDLEWMKRVGIGGFMLADVAYGGGQQVPVKIDFGTRAWLDAVRYSA